MTKSAVLKHATVEASYAKMVLPGSLVCQRGVLDINKPSIAMFKSRVSLSNLEPLTKSKTNPIFHQALKVKMCGYEEVLTPCCHEKTGFFPAMKCSLYSQNNRYCRTGSVHSWILSSPPVTSKVLCDECKKIGEHEIAALDAEIRAREKTEEETRRGEEARQLRELSKEVKRRSDGRREERQSAAAALKSQLAGLRIENLGEGPSSLSRK